MHAIIFLYSLILFLGRGFFNWSLIKLMIKNQSKVDHFLKVLITLPGQVSTQINFIVYSENLNNLQRQIDAYTKHNLCSGFKSASELPTLWLISSKINFVSTE